MAVDEQDWRGIIDRVRLACGGHGYGALSTASAQAHTPFFKTGIAGGGSHNRTRMAIARGANGRRDPALTDDSDR